MEQQSKASRLPFTCLSSHCCTATAELYMNLRMSLFNQLYSFVAVVLVGFWPLVV